jgi:hypothetical protein
MHSNSCYNYIGRNQNFHPVGYGSGIACFVTFHNAFDLPLTIHTKTAEIAG